MRIRRFLTALLIAAPAIAHGLDRLTLAELQSWRSALRTDTTGTVAPMRADMLKEIAGTVCAQGGQAVRSDELADIQEEYADYYDRVYRFDQLLLENGLILPLAIQEIVDRATLKKGQLRRDDLTYRKFGASRLVTRAPTWRDYLSAPVDNPVRPDETLLPKTNPESTIWRRVCAQAWQAGIAHETQDARIKLRRLNQVYVGIVRFHFIMDRKLISGPRIKRRARSYQISGNELRIGSQDVRITREARWRRRFPQDAWPQVAEPLAPLSTTGP